MTELKINGSPVVLKDKSTIKLTRENVYFTKSSSYTYDVEIPLDIPQNIAIFGNIHRLDISKTNKTFTAELRSDNKLLLTGAATITEVTETNIKIQLLGGNSELNFYQNGEKQYVDELDLGSWLDVIHWTPTGNGNYTGSTYGIALYVWTTYKYMISTNGINAAAQWLQEFLFSRNDKYVCFPCYNTTTSVLENELVMRLRDETYYPEFRLTFPGEGMQSNGDPWIKLSFQPYLIFAIERVLNALGYSWDDGGVALLKNPLLRGIFIATANNRIEIAKALPHWTVNEFFTQIEQFLGVAMVVDEQTKIISVIPRAEYFSTTPITIKDVVEEYSVAIEKSENADIAAGNVGYDSSDSDPFALLDSEIVAKATFDSSYSSFEELQTHVKNDDISKEMNKIFIVKGRQFIVTNPSENTFYLQEVNYLRTRMSNSQKTDLDVTMKIVPCKIASAPLSFVKNEIQTAEGYDIDTETYTDKVKALSMPDALGVSWYDKEVQDVKPNLYNIIQGETPATEATNDKMFVAICNAPMQRYTWGAIRGQFPTPHVHGVEVISKDIVSSPVWTDSLALNPIDGMTTLGAAVITSQKIFDKTTKYCIRFVDSRILNAGAIYLINNKLFVCEHFEYDIDNDGISPLVTGYFYELKN